MNPAAPSPSDSSIAQAFRDYAHLWPLSWAVEFVDKRAREIGASAPAAAVGGGELLAYQYQTGEHDWRDCTPQIYLSMQGRGIGVRKVYTHPQPPAGGFVVVPIADVLMMIDVANEWGHLHHNYVRADDIERWQYSPLVEELHDRLKAMIAASPAAQPSAKDGVRVEDRALDTSRRRSAVELLLSLGYTWHDDQGVWIDATTASGLVDGAIADLFWNDADNEIAYRSIAELVNRQWEGGNVQDGTLLTIQRAQSMATITIRLSVPDEYPDGDTEITWEATIGREVGK